MSNGLNFLKREKTQKIVYPVLVAVALIGLWQWVVVAFEVPQFLVPSPVRIVQIGRASCRERV